GSKTWKTPATESRLFDIGQNEFRLRFRADAWRGKIAEPQMMLDGVLSTLAPSFVPPRGRDYCIWRPRSAAQANPLLDSSKMDSMVHLLEFKKDIQAGMSAVFEVQSDSGAQVGVLQCFFPKSQTPADISLSMWRSITVSTIELEVPN